MIKIVIVDDEAHIRTLLEQTLEELEDDFEFEVITAANGEEGLSTIENEKPKLVFLDIMMPKMNGYEVCSAVTSNPELKNTRIVMLTAKGQEADKTKGFDAGAHYFITKPFDPEEILTLGRSILGE